MSTVNNKTAEILRSGRLAKGYTQLRLSELSKVSLRSIQRIENGEVKPRMDTLNLLASELEINLESLMLNQKDTIPAQQPGRPGRLIVEIGIAVVTLLLGAAYLSQSPTFPETTFELFLFWAGIITLYLVIIFRRSKR